ncbi:MAG TPA: hypothetical protein EYP63_02460 [Desulfotomaculum sp.]|nr:hypothetical protein [Desulfotomaculum sp.]
MTNYRAGAHCRLDHITEAEWGKLPPGLREELTRVLSGRVIGRRLPEVVKELRAREEADLARELVRCVRSEPGV